MSRRRASRSIEGHYNYYGIPAYILKQKNGAYASGFFDPVDKVFKAGGSVKKILWDGIKIPLEEAKKLIDKHSEDSLISFEDHDETPDWILLPDEASLFLAQSDQNRSESIELKKLFAPKEDRRPKKT